MKTYLLTFLFVFSAVLLNAQITTGEIIYTVSLNKEKFEKEFENKKKTTTHYRIMNNIKNVEAILKFSGTESLYEVSFLSKDESNNRMNVTLIKAGNKKKYYTNSFKKQTLEQDCDLIGECFRIKEDFIKWELTQESKIIGGQTCYLAKGKEKYEGKEFDVFAWYDPTLNINFGPKKYVGLPGLIVEIQEGMFVYKAKKITLSRTPLKIEKPTKGKIVTPEEFNEIAKKYFPKELQTN